MRRSTRDALLDAILPLGDPPDRASFWSSFREVAPPHVRLGLTAATVAVGGVWSVLRTGRTLGRLDADRREAVVVSAMRWPLLRDLVEVAKIMACMAHFDDPAAQRALRGPG